MSNQTKHIIFNRIFGTTIQVLFIFIFLTIFFFTYVKIIEKKAFKEQINLVVDDLVPLDKLGKLKAINKKNHDYLLMMLDGIIDVTQLNSVKSSRDADEKIKKDNNAIFIKSIKGVIYTIIFIIIIIIFLKIGGIEISHKIHFKDALIMIAFVAITEFLFLTFITGSYWSVNRKKVRDDLSSGIEIFLKNKKLFNINK